MLSTIKPRLSLPKDTGFAFSLWSNSIKRENCTWKLHLKTLRIRYESNQTSVGWIFSKTFKRFSLICYCSEKVDRAFRQLSLSLLPILGCVVPGFTVCVSRSFITTLAQTWVSEKVTDGGRDALLSYLPHGVVLYCNFSEEEVDIVPIIHCLDKVRFCRQKGTLIGDMSHSIK